MNLRFGACLLVLLSANATGGQAIYKCEENGAITYTDQPCSPTAQPHLLPAVIVAAPPTRAERDLARAHDARIARERGERDRDDGKWLEQHKNRRDREARVRKAILEHKVLKGMTMDEVRQALGEPDVVADGESYGNAKETWTYTASGESRTVNFKNGEVISSGAKRKGGRSGGRGRSGAQ